MKNNDAFGCTTFRKGNYLGRSYDFFCNSIASSVLHTSRIEGVRYESIGMSGSSFNGMTKDKALDGTIDKSIMDTLFSSIVDGINEKGVAISTLVVPRGDKGITTGTNPSKPSITARLVSRVVMDKAYSAKNAIKLLSELNIVQTAWNPEYELHWMIADANDTYIVETVNNRLSYRGPSAVTGELDNSIVAGYDGTLEADVITNFYVSGTDLSQGEHTFEMPVDNPTITPYGAGLERFQLIKDAIEDATLSSDEEAMEIINLVQYTTAYKNDTEWYSEFVDHAKGITNRTELTAIKNTGKLSDRVGFEPDISDNRWFYEVLPPTDSSYFGSWGTSEKFFDIKSESHDESLRVNQGDYWGNHGQLHPTLDPNKWYTEIRGGNSGTDYEDLSDIHYVSGGMKELIRSVTTSDFVDGVNGFKELYAEIWAEGEKEAVRYYGDTEKDVSWHSNHQCVYDLANKKMLVYPSENGEHAFRVDIHGVVEDEAVKLNED